MVFRKIVLGLSLAIPLSVLPVTVHAAATGAKPNVVLIYGDDVGYGDLSCYGATKVQTPHLDKLAAEGKKFTNAHSTAATCTPSRYSILTGQYAWRKKGTSILPGNNSLIIPTDKTTLGKVFQQAGYQTACIGKWHLGLGPDTGPDWNSDIKPGPNEVGFNYTFIFPATADRVPTVYVKNHKVIGLDPADPIQVSYKDKVGTEPTGKENPELLKMASSPGQGHADTIVNGIGRIGFMSGGKAARWTDESLAADFTQEAEDFLDRNTSSPFFLYFNLSDIHVPRMPGTRFKGQSELGLRGDAILQMDYTVGRLLTKLEQLGIANNTIVMFSSDNGPVLDDGYIDEAVEKQNGHQPGGPFRGGKYSILEAGTRVPLIVRWPHQVHASVSGALVSQLDFLASFAAILNQNLKPDGNPDGVDMSSTLLGNSEKSRENVVVEGRALAILAGDFKYIEPNDGPAVLQRVNIESGYSEKAQLYNLADDPSERINLIDKQPELAAKLAAQLQTIKSQRAD